MQALSEVLQPKTTLKQEGSPHPESVTETGMETWDEDRHVRLNVTGAI